MGAKISAVHGVKSDHFYDQGNAINEIWVGDVEIISRLPFGDSDLEQAGWPAGGWPKIPWHQFVIPMRKRDNMSESFLGISPPPAVDNWLPTHGYLGIYTRIDWCIAYALGSFLLLIGFVLYLIFVYNIVCAFHVRRGYNAVPKQQRNLSVMGLVYRRPIRRHVMYAFLKLAFSVLFVVLGIPGVVAGMQRFNAGMYVFINATVICLGFPAMSILFFLYLMYWSRRRSSAVDNEAVGTPRNAVFSRAMSNPEFTEAMRACSVDLVFLHSVIEALGSDDLRFVILQTDVHADGAV
jgi:hypothetical protein